MVDASMLYPGVRVRIIDSWDKIPREKQWHNRVGLMDKWLGRIVTIRTNAYDTWYKIHEDIGDEGLASGWLWRIDGFAEIIDDPRGFEFNGDAGIIDDPRGFEPDGDDEIIDDLWDFEPDGDIAEFLGL